MRQTQSSTPIRGQHSTLFDRRWSSASESRVPVWYLQPIGQHASGAFVIGSMEAGPPESIPAFTLFHPDMMSEAWAAPRREDPYAGEIVLGDSIAADLPAPDAKAPLVPIELSIPDAPDTKGGGAF